ncbi:MAG: DUF4124 domain-containing protein [Acidimicrobiia bacterium]
MSGPIDGVGDFTYGEEIAAEVQQYYGHAALNTHNFAPAVYTVPAEQPPVSVTPWDCQGRGSFDPGFVAQIASVPIPSDAVIPPDSDASIIVWQPSSNTVWEFWKTRRVDGAWQACWGGRLESASKSIGTFPFPYGAAASGLSQLAGLITLEELKSGHIDHAISIGVVNTRKGVVSWPANRTDGKSLAPNAIPEGQRLRLDPSLDLSTLSLTPMGRMVAVALQRYGAIVRDSAGSVAVYAENAIPLTAPGQPNPYEAFYGGKGKSAQLDGIPWARLQALPLDYGKTP